MGTAKLMTPLFYDGNYNAEGKRMRAVLEREVSNGVESYRLWRSDGKPDLEYPRAANDAYILHVEVNDHLVPLRMTDYALVNHCGLLPATIALYGSEEGRKEYFKHLRDSGAAGTGAFTEAMARETEKIIELGNDSARQADYIKSVLDQHVAAFLDSKECDGKSFPDFVGALILEEIPSCLALRTKYRAYKQEEALKRQAEQEEQDRAFCEERNRKAEQMIDLAIRTIRGGGTLKNEPTPDRLQSVLQDNDRTEWVFSRLEEQWKQKYYAVAVSPPEHGTGNLCPISFGKYKGKYSARWIDCAHCHFNVAQPPCCLCVAGAGIQKKEDFKRDLQDRLFDINKIRRTNEEEIRLREERERSFERRSVCPRPTPYAARPVVPAGPTQEELDAEYIRICQSYDPTSDEWTVDRYNRRWIMCTVCGRIKQDAQMSYYGGKGGANRGVCADCSRNGRS